MRVAGAAVLGAMMCAVSACGELGARYTGMRVIPPSPVVQQAVARYPAGTPQRTVLEWFRALQARDIERATAFYAPEARISPNVILFERVAGSRYFAQAQLPRIIGTSTAGTHATVFTVIDFRWSAPDGRGAVYFRPQAFELQRRRGVWQLADNYFLESTALLAPQGPCVTC